VLDVSNAAAPFEVGSLDTPGESLDVSVAGTYAYLADGTAGLRVVDVLDPGAPAEVASYDTGDKAQGIAVAGDVVYMADNYGGLVILQFPAAVVGTVPPGGGALFSPLDQTGYTFPAGTFSGEVIIAHVPLLPADAPAPGRQIDGSLLAGLAGIDHFFDLSAVYADTGLPAAVEPGHTYTVTVRYSDAQLGTVIEDSLAFYHWDGAAWVLEPSSAVDTVHNVVTASPNHLSVWGVLGGSGLKSIYLPLVLWVY